VIAIIMVVGYVQPGFFISALILKPEDEAFYMVLGCLIVMGAFSLATILCHVYLTKISNCSRLRAESLNNDKAIKVQENVALETENA